MKNGVPRLKTRFQSQFGPPIQQRKVILLVKVLFIMMQEGIQRSLYSKVPEPLNSLLLLPLLVLVAAAAAARAHRCCCRVAAAARRRVISTKLQLVTNRGNTTNLKNHLDRCRLYQDVKVEGDPKQQVLFRQKGKDKDDGVVKVSGRFSQEACRMALVKMIVKDKLPFSFMEAKGFLEFMQTCCPRFDVPSRRTITRDILELYQHEKGLLKSVLGASKQRVCITTDT
ncbi:hypothetical protein WN944_005990 [Citrus x changshan-huyou]|uniref:Uncharacterized protein n=1 Tax=Citrus x changshan-huyou TaxID=2935761 RepID=A0AAP0QTC9_9ROSI